MSAIEVVIGLSFLFAVLSLIASAINELIASALALRARTLKSGVRGLLDDPVARNAIWAHPLIQSLYKSRIGPSYIPAEKFALALLDQKVVPAVGQIADQAQHVSETISALPDGRLKSVLDVLWRDANQDAAELRKRIEDWFDSAMERVAGWYRRLVQFLLLSIGLALAIGLNINTLTITQRLWSDAPLRTAVVEQAQRAVPPSATDANGVKSALDNVQSGLKTLDGLSLPMGWGKAIRPTAPVTAVAGWLLTAAAVSLGAPFWFDLLGRFTRLRATGDPPKASTS